MQYHNRFNNVANKKIVGKKVSELSLSAVGGASDTTDAFNEVVASLQFFEVQALIKKTPLEESFFTFFFSSFPYIFSMQKYSLDVIGTHLDIYIDTTEEISILFESIRNRLQDFEKKYSRFLE